MSTFPWDIYASQLWNTGFGHPLWIPEPNEREVEIGDVGWLKKGEFRPLFNSRKPEGDPTNQKGVPRAYKMFNPKNSSVLESTPIMQKMVCSQSIHKFDVQGNADANM